MHALEDMIMFKVESIERNSNCKQHMYVAGILSEVVVEFPV